MIAYLVRRLIYAVPQIIGINFLAFMLFFVVNTPDDMARMNLGQKHVTAEAIEKWKHERGYDQPLFWNAQVPGVDKMTQTVFYHKSLSLILFRYGQSDAGRDIGADIAERMWPSLAIAVPSMLAGLGVEISIALLLIFFRRTYIDFWGGAICVFLMSVSTLFIIIGSQYLMGKLLRLTPISGYDTGLNAIRFVILPVMIGVFSGLGSGVRWYRTLFQEEVEKEYVRTARAKGLGDARILFSHVLKNAMIPILTGVVVVLPLLFTGSLITESFFAIPGLGSYTIDAINQQDFAIIRSMVMLGSMLYMLGLLLTDISYMLVDPRVKLD